MPSRKNGSKRTQTESEVESIPTGPLECFHVSVDGPDEATAVGLRIAIQNKLTGSVRFAGSQGARCAVVLAGAGDVSAADTLQALIQSGVDGWQDGYTYLITADNPLVDLESEDAALAAIDEARKQSEISSAIAQADLEDSLAHAEIVRTTPAPSSHIPFHQDLSAENAPDAGGEGSTDEVT